MNGTKAWYQSRGVVFPVISAFVTLLTGLGLHFYDGFAEDATSIVLLGGSFVTALMGAWGRVQAKTTIRGN